MKYEIQADFELNADLKQALGSFSAVQKEMDKMSAFQDRISKMANIGQKSFSAIESVMKKSAQQVGAFLQSSLGNYIEFDDTITAANAKFGGTSETLEALKKAALDVAGATRFNSLDTSGALDKMAMAGMSAADSMAVLLPMANMAMATGKDMTSAVDMATDALGAFNLMKDEAGEPLSGDALASQLTRMSDVVSRATNAANLDMDMWFESAKQGAAAFSAFGGSLEEFSAIAGILANNGIKGSAGGTAIRNIMLGFTGQTAPAMKALKALGIETFDAEGKMKPFADLIEQLSAGLNGLGDDKKSEYLSDMFGKENISSALLLVNEGADKINEFTAMLQNAGGATDEMSRQMNSSLSGSIEMLKSALDTLGQSLMKVFDSKEGRALIDSLTEKIGYFTKNVIPQIQVEFAKIAPSIQSFLTRFMDSLPVAFDFMKNVALPVLGVFAQSVMNILSFMQNHSTFSKVLIGGIFGVHYALLGLLKVFPLIRAATVAYNFVLGVGKGIALARQAAEWGVAASIEGSRLASISGAIGMKLYSIGVGIATFATKAATVATTAFTAVLSFLTSPIGVVIAAVALLAVGVYNLVKHWDAVCAAMQRVGDWFVALGDVIAEWALNAWNAVSAFFVGIGEGVAGAFSGVVDGVSSVLGGVLGVVSGAWGAITSVFQSGSLLAVFESIGSGILSFVLSPLEKVLGMLTWVPFVGDDIAAWQQKIIALRSSSASSGAKVSPTKTMAESSMYSENVSSARLEIGVEKGVSASAYGSIAPNITVERRAAGF